MTSVQDRGCLCKDQVSVILFVTFMFQASLPINSKMDELEESFTQKLFTFGFALSPESSAILLAIFFIAKYLEHDL